MKNRTKQKVKTKEEFMNDFKKGESNILVCVRVRPENQMEQIDSSKTKKKVGTIIKVIDENMLVFDPIENNSEKKNSFCQRKIKDEKFAFDCVFDENASQTQVYQNTTKILLEGVLNGFNSTVFAYGATGSGKT
jgi:kinesin family protein 18/19